MVADACPALGTMPAIDVGGSEVLALGCGRAMNDEFVDGSHNEVRGGVSWEFVC